MIVTLDTKKRAADLIEKSGFSVGAFARRIGTSYSTLWNFLHGDTRNFGKIQQLADALGISLYQLTTGNLDDSAAAAPIAADPAAAGYQSPPAQAGKIPVYQQQGEDGAYALDSDIAEHVSRLIGDGVSRLFALRVAGDSMAPRYRWGEIVYCGHNLRPKPGDDCLVERADKRGLLKTYAGEDSGVYIFRQLNPPQEWRCPAGEIRALHVVIGRG